MGKKPAVMFLGIRICGMHHYEVGASFKLVRETENRRDKFSIAVKDGTKAVAHIRREDAAKLAPLFDNRFAINETVYFKVKHQVEVNHKREGQNNADLLTFIMMRSDAMNWNIS